MLHMMICELKTLHSFLLIWNLASKTLYREEVETAKKKKKKKIGKWIMIEISKFNHYFAQPLVKY